MFAICNFLPVCQKPSVKFTNGNHMTTEYCVHCNCEPVAKHLNHSHVTGDADMVTTTRIGHKSHCNSVWLLNDRLAAKGLQGNIFQAECIPS